MPDSDKTEASAASRSVDYSLGLVGLYAVNSPAPNSGAKDPPKPALKQEQPDNPRARVPNTDPLLKPIEEFHAASDGQWGPEDLGRDVHGYQTEFLIATVPDPLDSPFGFAFDQTVDAIQRGVQQKDGYLLDRAWLPWEVDKKKPTPAPGAAPAPDLRDNMPGVLLFRHGKDAAKGVKTSGLCVVFLVGETPLGGIHKRAFWKALKLIADSGRQPDEPIRVVGPYFTGSQTSLQFLLEDWLRAADQASWWGRTRPTRFKVIAGNAAGMRMKEFFRDTWGPEKIDITSTIASGRIQLNAILHFLTSRDGARATDPITSGVVKNLPGRIAILTESNTGFGKQFAAYGEQNDVVVLRFPLHVSRLKSEYAQVFRKQDEQAGLHPAAAVSIAGFEDAGAMSEGVPAQGGAATTAANNAVLANILSTISRERFRYVGVMATDPRDKLFLIRLIREFCPDVHVFVTQGDLLLTHPDYLYHMKGVLVGSTYPLYPPNQRWVRPDAPERMLVSSAAAQGYYNATLAVLGLHDQMLEYGPPGFATGPNVPNDRPPVWVSMVAPNGTLVPLQLFTGYEDTNGAVWRRTDGGTAPPLTDIVCPGPIALAGVALGAFWLVLLLKCWRGRGVGREPASGAASFAGVSHRAARRADGAGDAAPGPASCASTHQFRSPADTRPRPGGRRVAPVPPDGAPRVSLHRPRPEAGRVRAAGGGRDQPAAHRGLRGVHGLVPRPLLAGRRPPHRVLFFVRAVDLATGCPAHAAVPDGGHHRARTSTGARELASAACRRPSRPTTTACSTNSPTRTGG